MPGVLRCGQRAILSLLLLLGVGVAPGDDEAGDAGDAGDAEAAKTRREALKAQRVAAVRARLAGYYARWDVSKAEHKTDEAIAAGEAANRSAAAAGAMAAAGGKENERPAGKEGRAAGSRAASSLRHTMENLNLNDNTPCSPAVADGDVDGDQSPFSLLPTAPVTQKEQQQTEASPAATVGRGQQPCSPEASPVPSPRNLSSVMDAAATPDRQSNSTPGSADGEQLVASPTVAVSSRLCGGAYKKAAAAVAMNLSRVKARTTVRPHNLAKACKDKTWHEVWSCALGGYLTKRQFETLVEAIKQGAVPQAALMIACGGQPGALPPAEALIQTLSGAAKLRRHYLGLFSHAIDAAPGGQGACGIDPDIAMRYRDPCQGLTDYSSISTGGLTEYVRADMGTLEQHFAPLVRNCPAAFGSGKGAEAAMLAAFKDGRSFLAVAGMHWGYARCKETEDELPDWDQLEWWPLYAP